MSLKTCIPKLQKALREFDVDEVIDSAREYQRRGKPQQEAELAAIDDHIRELQRLRQNLTEQVVSAYRNTGQELQEEPKAARGEKHISADVDAYGKPERAAIRREIKRRWNADSLTADLKRLEGTPWAEQAIKGLLVRAALNELAAGREPKFASLLDHRQIVNLPKMARARQAEGVWHYLESVGVLGEAAKPVNSVPSSISNCSPTSACAIGCYTFHGHHRYASPTVKAELVQWAVDADPKRVAKMIADEYERTIEYKEGIPLRLFDVGDISPPWVPLIKELNRRGVYIQTFSKNPEVLREVPEENVRLMSGDYTNIEDVRANPDLPVAMTYEHESLNPFLEELKDSGRLRVIFPLKKGSHVLSDERQKAMPKWAQKLACKPDTGVKIGKGENEWWCGICSRKGGAYCFKGEKAHKLMQALATVPTREARAKAHKEILDATEQAYRDGRIPEAEYNEFIRTLDRVLSPVLSDYDVAGEGTGREGDVGKDGITDAEAIEQFRRDQEDDTKYARSAFKVAPSDTEMMAAIKTLAAVDELFRHPVSDKKGLDEILADVYPHLKIIGYTHQLATNPVGDPDNVGWHVIWAPDGNPVNVFTRNDGTVYIDAGMLEAGSSGGSAIYAAVMNYAYNNDLVFVPDPAAISDDALIRRTEHMLSAAIKYGTTKHMLPDAGQKVRWTVGNDDANLRALLNRSQQNLLDAFPDMADLTYNFDKRRLERLSDGSPVTEAALADLARSGPARKARAGTATLARAAFMRALLQGARQRSQIRREYPGAEQISEALNGVFYSRAEESHRENTREGVAQYIASKIGRKAYAALTGEGGPVRIITTDEIPHHIAEKWGTNVYGWSEPNGDTVLVADNLTMDDGPVDAYAIFLHEVGVHYGMPSMLGEDLFNEAIEAVQRALLGIGDRQFVRAARRAYARVPSKTPQSQIAEETLAWLVTDFANARLPLYKRLLAAIRAFLFKKGWSKNLDQFALAELAAGAVKHAAKEMRPTTLADLDPAMTRMARPSMYKDAAVSDEAMTLTAKNVETGKPVTFVYTRNPEKAPFMGGQFGQDVEPAGRYVLAIESGDRIPAQWESGVLTFQNPLVIEWGEGYTDASNWKRVLSRKYNATGQALTTKLRAEGYDGIITVKDRETSEIVDLLGRRVLSSEPLTVESLLPSRQTDDLTMETNTSAMIAIMGPNLYNNLKDDGLAQVTVKELFQNAFDAVKDAIDRGMYSEDEQPAISISIDPATRTISVSDNGVGMTRKIVQDALFTIGGTEKGDLKTTRRSGGFGVAKMLFLFNNENLHVRTVRDGEETIVNTTAAELRESSDKGTAIKDVVVRNTTDPNGTTVTLTLPESIEDPETGVASDLQLPEFLSSYYTLEESPLFENVEVTWNGRSTKIGLNLDTDVISRFADVEFLWGNATIYTHKRTAGPYSHNMFVLSAGLYQFSEKIQQDLSDVYGESIDRVFYIDIRPNVGARHSLYPFMLNRQGFKEDRKKDIAALVQYLHRIWFGQQIAKQVANFGVIRYLDENTFEVSDPTVIAPKAEDLKTSEFDPKPGDTVEIKDGEMIINGQQVHVMTRDELSKQSGFDVRAALSLVGALDTKRAVLHNNVSLDAESVRTELVIQDMNALMEKAKDGRINIDDVMVAKFGERYYEAMAGITRAFRQAMSLLAAEEPRLTTENWGVGVSLDWESRRNRIRGVNVPAPIQLLALNPLVFTEESAEKQAGAMISTMIHEIAHIASRGHGADHGQRMQELFAAVMADSKALADLKSEVYNTLRDFKNVFVYGKALFDDAGLDAQPIGRSLEGLSNETADVRVPEFYSGGRPTSQRARRDPGLGRGDSATAEESDRERLFARGPADRRVTQTPAFKKWFKDSKVVDANGQPLVVYHGTFEGDEFDAINVFGGRDFKSDHAKWLTAIGDWFTADPDVANYFAERGPTEEGFIPHVYPVYLSIQNPYVVRTYDQLEEEYDESGMRSVQGFAESLQAEGYDGIEISQSTTDTDTSRRDFVPFNPSQIKSATGNQGTFDPENPDIRFARPGGLYSGYGRPSNLPSRERAPSVRETAPDAGRGGQLDLFSGQGLPHDVARAQAADTFFVGYKQVPVDAIRSGIDTVNTPEEAAHVLAPMRKRGQESFMVLVAGEDGRILNVIRHSTGIKDASLVDPVIVAGAIANTDGAANVWFAHNHPSGRAIVSSSDRMISDLMDTALTASGIKTLGHLLFSTGSSEAVLYGVTGDTRITIKPLQRTRSINVTERAVRKSPKADRVTIKGPTDAIDLVDKLKLESGILLLDNIQNVNGVMAMSQKEMQTLREGGRVNRILRAIDTTNASAAIVVAHSEPALNNVATYLNRLGKDMRVLDGILRTPHGAESLAAMGQKVGDNQRWYARPVDGFYSPTLAAVEAATQKKQTPQQWKAHILRNGGRKEEMDWIDLDGFFEGKKTVTQAELEDFIWNNRVILEESVREYGAGRAFHRWYAEPLNRARGWYEVFDERGDYVGLHYADSEEEAVQEAVNREPHNEDADPLYHEHTLPGGYNYREFVLTLPEVEGDFESQHYAMRNVVVHIRTKERVDSNGKKVLMIEEMQSDWHQQGRRKGYVPKDPQPQGSEHLEIRRNEETGGWELWNKNLPEPEYPNRISEHSSRADAEAAMAKAAERPDIPPGAVDDAPFKKSWHMLAFKRMLRYAAENGFDSIAWTTGEQQAERYDMSLHVEEIIASPMKDPAGGTDIWSLRIKQKSGFSYKTKAWGDDKLEETLGKDMAERIIKDGGGQYSGLDLKIGGEGMKGFYDAILVNDVNKYVKKWGVRVVDSNVVVRQGTEEVFVELSAVVGEDIFDETETTTVHAVPITEEMREHVGLQPLFARQSIGRQVTQRLGDHFRSQRIYNRWWHLTVGTQFHKARIHKKDGDAFVKGTFGYVFNLGQDYLNGVSKFSMDAEAKAPDLLARMETIKEAFKWGPSQKEMAPVARALYDGTLAGPGGPAEGLVWTPEQLRRRYGLSDRQIEYYQQARAAVDQSLDTLAMSTMFKLARNLHLPFDMEMDLGQSTEALRMTIADAIDDANAILQMWLDDGAEETDPHVKRTRARIKNLQDTRKAIDKIERDTNALKEGGYFPLMRFGEYTMHVVNTNGDTIFFGLYESQADANSAERDAKELWPDARIEKTILNTEEYKMFSGTSPETLMLFASHLDVEQAEALQKYYAYAVSNRSAFRRFLHRKRTPGFNEDAIRTLASLVTSNARMAARNIYLHEMQDGIQAINKHTDGDAQKEAQKLYDAMTDPREEAAGFRGLLYVQFIGGSVASAAVNSTQPAMMTAPFLAQFVGIRKATRMTSKAMMEAARHARPVDVGPALDRAAQEGIVAPHEIYQLMGRARGAKGADKLWHSATRVWGSFFSLAEAFNRRATFIAAYRVAVDTGMPDPYEFAKQAVAETQGLYNKGNRPNWARGAPGAIVFTFKQFSIAYIEFLVRLPPKERAFALALLWIMTGLQGLPGMDDLDDIIDTVGQLTGHATQSKRWRHDLLRESIGKPAADFAEHGISTLLPLDVSLRFSLGNLIPGTSYFKRSEQNRAREAMEVFGPAGGLLQQVSKATERVAKAQPGRAAFELAPKAMRDYITGGSMAWNGEYRNIKGELVADTDMGDSFWKFFGFNPDVVARETREMNREYEGAALQRIVEQSIADRWARALFVGDAAGERAAVVEMREWNERNPKLPVVITKQQLKQRVKRMHQTRTERFQRRLPPEMRGAR